jgi:hypothetical protein
MRQSLQISWLTSSDFALKEHNHLLVRKMPRA